MRIDPSIQDFWKRINSKILTSFHPSEIITFCLLCFSLLFFIVFLSFWTRDDRHIFVYKEGDVMSSVDQSTSRLTSLVFGSKSGKVYYFSWCKAGNRVKEQSKVYFKSEEEVKSTGRTLSKVCK